MSGLALVLLPALALPAGPTWPTREAIERVLDARPFPDSRRLDQVPLPGLPRLAPSLPGLDIEELASRHVKLYQQHREEAHEATALRIFVTLSMPESSLRLLADQAERAGATLVLRGLKDNSMKQTLASVQALIGERKLAWQIDPEAFTRFSVRQAPTFVLSRPTVGHGTRPASCAGNCAVTADYFSVAGDVSLDYALDAIVRRHPDAGRYAAPFLKRLRVTP